MSIYAHPSYSYVRHHHKVEYYPLQVNYRSSQTLVDFTKRAGYDPDLHAHHADLRLAFLPDAIQADRPGNWPSTLYWTPDWMRLLDPSKSATCFIYDDEVTGQANDFEADAVAALLWLLFGRNDRQLAGELNADGSFRQLTNDSHGVKGRRSHAAQGTDE